MTLFLVIGIVATAGAALYLIGTMIRSIQVERRRSQLQRVWRHFGCRSPSASCS